VLIVAAQLAMVPSVAVAQFTELPPSAEECTAALNSMKSSSAEWSRIVIFARCENAAQSISDAILTAKNSTTEGHLEALLAVSSRLVDQRIANSALTVAESSASSEPARFWSLMILIGQALPNFAWPDFNGLNSATISSPCLIGEVGARGPESLGLPVSVATWAQVLGASATAHRGTTKPLRVRRAAICLFSLLQSQAVESVVRASDIQLTYLCGNRFRIRNRNLSSVKVRWDVYGTTETETEEIESAPVSLPFRDYNINTFQRGTVRLYLGAQLIQTKANGGGAQCTEP
jgi:hypothetical protein